MIYLIELLDDGNRSNLSEFFQGENEQFNFLSDEFDKSLHGYEFFDVDDAYDTEVSEKLINNTIFLPMLYDISQENNISTSNIISPPKGLRSYSSTPYY